MNSSLTLSSVHVIAYLAPRLYSRMLRQEGIGSRTVPSFITRAKLLSHLISEGESRYHYILKLVPPEGGLGFMESKMSKCRKLSIQVPVIFFLKCWQMREAKGHFTHETESPWPVHFKHSHWWTRQRWSKFASHYAWRTNGVCGCKMHVKSTWIPTWHWMDHVSWSLGLFSKMVSWR